MNERDLVHHGLAIKRHASAAAVAALMGVPEPRARTILSASAVSGRAVEVDDGYALTPLARVALEARYSLHFQGLRDNADFMNAYHAFENLNRQLKLVVTEWQTVQVGGRQVPNDHSDKAHDAAIIERLGKVHDQAEVILGRLARHVPRLRTYLTNLQSALEAAEDGAVEWVSDVRRNSYHTVWFEFHEDILRITGRVREG